MTDHPIFERINEPAREEEALWQKAGSGNGLEHAERDRLDVIGVELDQCYDLLQQRGARREFGQDPEEARVRRAAVVDRYRQ